MNLIDTHAHLYEKPLSGDVAGVLRDSALAGVGAIIVPGVDLKTTQMSVGLADAYPGVVYAAAGLHPHCAGEDVSWLKDIAGSAGVAAIGEIGLDAVEGPPQPVQAEAFSRQLGIARELELPVIVHCRGAFGALMDLLRAAGAGGKGGVLHSYSASAELFKGFEKLGFYMGVSGVATRPEAVRVRAMLKAVPLGRMVLETDSPYIGTALLPKGTVTPASVAEVCEALAALKGEKPELVAEVTTANAKRLFKLQTS